MKNFILSLFLKEAPKKVLALSLAILIWLLVNHTLTVSKTLEDVSVRITSLPEDKTIDGMDPKNNYLTEKKSLTLYGKKSVLDELSNNDIEIVINAKELTEDSIVNVQKKHLVAKSSQININSSINKVQTPSFPLPIVKQVTHKVPIYISHPTGEPPRDYQYLDVSPYRLSITLRGPEKLIEKLQTSGLRRTFSLSEIKKRQLDEQPSRTSHYGEVVSFYVPESWKTISIPELSSTPFEIKDSGDPIRIEFIRNELLKIKEDIPVQIYFHPEFINVLNPENLQLTDSDFLKQENGLFLVRRRLFTKGVSRSFLDIVEKNIRIDIIVSPRLGSEKLTWVVGFIDLTRLEEDFVAFHLGNQDDSEAKDLPFEMRGKYLSERFRHYVNRFRLYTEDNQKLRLSIKIKDGKAVITEDKTKVKTS